MRRPAPAQNSTSFLEKSPAEAPSKEKPSGSFQHETGPLWQALYGDFFETVLPTLLRVFDRCSMAHGVEVRMPFLDYRLVSFCFSLPSQSKLTPEATKRVLRDAMVGRVRPSVIHQRRKLGFASPMQIFSQGAPLAWLMDTISSSSFAHSCIWSAPRIRSFVQDHLARKTLDYRAVEAIWPFVNAHVLTGSLLSS